MHSSVSVKKTTSRRCAICFIHKYHHPDRRFYRFPRDPLLCKKWLEIINEPYLMSKELKQLHISYCLCSLHFTEADYLTSKMCRLKPSACPSQFILNKAGLDISKLKQNPQLESNKIDLDISKMKQSLLNKLHPSNRKSDINDDANALDLTHEENYEGSSYKNSIKKSVVVAELVYKAPDNFMKTEKQEYEEYFTDFSFSNDLDESQADEQLMSLEEGLACLRRLKPLIEKIDTKYCTKEADHIERLSLLIETEIDKQKT